LILAKDLIKLGEEITLNYGWHVIKHASKDVPCLCKPHCEEMLVEAKKR